MEYIVELEGIHTVNDGDPILNSLSVCFLFFFIHLSLQNVIEYKIVKKKKSSKFFVSALKSSVTLTRRGHICIKFRLFIEQRDTLKSGKVFSITFESTYTNVRKNKLFCLTRINKNTFTKYESSFSFFSCSKTSFLSFMDHQIQETEIPLLYKITYRHTK